MQQESSPQPRLRLTEARNRRGLSQQALADELGTTHVNVSRWERGITKPSPYFRRKLSALFGKTEQELDLLPGDEEPATPLTTTTPKRSTTTTGSKASNNEQSPTAEPQVTPGALYDPAIPLGSGSPLIGRDEDLERVRTRLISGGNVALTALNGLPGVGKTALTIRLAHDAQIREYFSDGILWAGLGPHPNMQALLSRWGSLLNLSPNQVATLNTTADWARALRAAIGERKMLLVIDDAWTVEEALTFKVGGPNCAHLVTTRYPSIASLITVDGAVMLHELTEEQGLTLLRQLAPQIMQVEEQKAQDLVQAVGGLPLALTLMGNYLRKQAYTGQARRINAALQRLSVARERLHISEPHVPVESHPSLSTDTPISLQSVISVTDQLLDEPAREALYKLSVFPPKPNSFSEEAALVVAGCDPEALDLLNDSGLLESSGSGRYTLHQTIADYARLHLSDEAASAARQRLIDYAQDFVETHKKDYEALDQDSPTIQSAISQANPLPAEEPHAQNPTTATNRAALVRLIVAFAPFMLIRAWYAQAESYLFMAYEAARAAEDRQGIASVLLYRGQVAQRQGNFAQAEAYFQEGLTLARHSADNERVCSLLTELGHVSLKRGDFAQAEAYLLEGLELARKINDAERICNLLMTLGSLENNRGNYSLSEKYLSEGLILAREISSDEQILPLFVNLGAAAAEQGKYHQADHYFQEGLTIARQIGHREAMSVLLANLGDAASELGNYIQAEQYFQEGLTIARQIGHREWTCGLLINLGIMKNKQGYYQQAQTYLAEGLELAKQISRPQMVAHALYEYGSACLAQNNIDDAQKAFAEMLAMLPERALDLIALAHYGQARIAACRGDIQEARRLGMMSATTLATIRPRNVEEIQKWLASLPSDPPLTDENSRGDHHP